jgi:TRAP-type transport system small permease protein
MKNKVFLTNVFQKYLPSLSTISAICAGTLILLLVLWVTLSVLLRYVFNKPIPSSDEISGFIFLCAIFLGLGYTLFSEGHIRLDLLLSRLKGKTLNWVEVVWSVVGLIFAVLLFAGIWGLTVSYWSQKTVSSGVLRIPLIYPAVIASLGLIIFVLQSIARVYKTTLSLKKDKQGSAK